jgi:hypothetical protein
MAHSKAGDAQIVTIRICMSSGFYARQLSGETAHRRALPFTTSAPNMDAEKFHVFDIYTVYRNHWPNTPGDRTSTACHENDT